MFKIDFLKGDGLPTKSYPANAAMLALVYVAIVIVGCLLGIQYFANVSNIASKTKSLKVVEGLVKSATVDNGNADRAKVYSECIGEVAYSARRYVSWTPVLRNIAETLPKTMLVNSLNANRSIEKVKVTSRRDPKKKVEVAVLNRWLEAEIYDFKMEDDGSTLRKYLSDWRNSEQVAGVFDSIVPSRSKDATFKIDDKEQPVKSHVIECRLTSRQTVGKK